MRSEFVYSIIALGAIPVVANAADVVANQISTDVLQSASGKLEPIKVTLAPGSYTFKGSLLSKVYDVKVTIDGVLTGTIAAQAYATELDIPIDLSDKTVDTEVTIVFESTDPTESGADFQLGAPLVNLSFDFASRKSALVSNAEQLAATIGDYNYAAKAEDVEAANALKTKAEGVAETYDDYKNFKLYAEKSAIQEEIDALKEKADNAEAAYQNEQAYTRVNAAITAIKAKYNAAVAELETVLVGEAAYLLNAAKADLNENINKKITEASQASYASSQAGTAVVDEENNTALVPTEDALNDIVNDWKAQGEANQSAYNTLHGKVTALQAQLAAVTPVEAIASLFPKAEAEAAIEAVNTKVEAVKNSADQLTLDVTAEETAAQTKIDELAAKVNTANAEYNANEATNTAIATLQTNLGNAQTAVNALKSADGKYEAKNYYDAYVAAIQAEIDALSTAAAAAYKADGTGTAREYNEGLNTASIQSKIDTYAGTTEPATDGKPKQAVDKYDALQTAISGYTTALADARAQVEGMAVYTAEGYDYQTRFDLINKRINDIKKAIAAAQEKVGEEHWTAMLAISANEAITTYIAALLSNVQADQNQYDADFLANGMTTLEGKIAAFQAKDASVLGGDAAVFQDVETEISDAYNVVKTAKDAINAQSETVDYTAKVSTAASDWGGVKCPGDNSFAETYGQANAVAQTGVILQQTVNGVENGVYTVELYANANFTSGRGFNSDMADGATDVAYVFANGVQTPIVAHRDGGMDGSYTIANVVVSDGTLTMGLAKAKAGTNWHTIKIKSLKANTASLIQNWGAKVAELNKQQSALESLAEPVAAKVAANANAKTTLAASIDGLKAQIGTFTDTYKIGNDTETTLGNRGKADGAVTNELAEINIALNTLEGENNDFVATKVTNVDKTNNVGALQKDWIGATGLTGTQFAPAVEPADGRGARQMVENYNAGSCSVTGEILSQTISGLDNGIYEVMLYANAMAANNVDAANAITADANDVAYVFANDVKEYITAKKANSTTQNGSKTLRVLVSDGTLKLGLAKSKAGTNWHSIQIGSLTYHENDQLAAYNTAETGYNARYTALAAQEAKLEAAAPGIKTAVENNAAAKTAADAATASLDTYLDNLKSLPGVTNADGEYDGYAQPIARRTVNGAEWWVYQSGLDDDKTFKAEKQAVLDKIAAMKAAVNAANAAETLPYPWADEITVTTEDNPETADVNEASSTTYKVSEIKAAVDAIKEKADFELKNYNAYDNAVQNYDQGENGLSTALTNAAVDLETKAGAGAFQHYTTLVADYQAKRDDLVKVRMVASLNARTAQDEMGNSNKGFIKEMIDLKALVNAVQPDAAANLAKYTEQKAAATETQTLWNNTFTEISATDHSSKVQEWLDELDAIQVDLTAASNAVEENYKVGKSVVEAKDFAGIQARINDVKARQSEAYSAQIAEDNKAAHESFMGNETTKGAIQLATEAYQRAVQERAQYSSANEDIKAAVDAAAAALDEALYNCPNQIADLTSRENAAYVATVSPAVFDVNEFNGEATHIEQSITNELNNFKSLVQAAINDNVWTPKKTEYQEKVAAAEEAIAAYSEDAKTDAFKDVKDLIAKGDAGVQSITLSEVEAAIEGLENIDDMLAADKDAAAVKDINAAIAAADQKYGDVKAYIEGVTNDIPAKGQQLTALETAYEENVTAAKQTVKNFETHDGVVEVINNFNTAADGCKSAVENAVANDNANTEAYNEIDAALKPVEAKLAEAKAAAAPYKYDSGSFATVEEYIADDRAGAESAKSNGDAVQQKSNLLGYIAEDNVGIDDALTAAFNTEKTGLSADITELKNQYNAYVAANGLNEQAQAFKTDIDALETRLTEIAIVEVDDPADGIKYNDILAATQNLVKLQSDIADKESELLAANASTANADVLANFNEQLSAMEATASLEGYDKWVGQQTYGDTTLGDAITGLKAQIADLKAAIQAEKNISFYKDQYQAQIDEVNTALVPVAAEIAAKQAQFEANAANYATLSAQINELQGKIDAAKEKVGAYEYAADSYKSIIEQYTNPDDPTELTGGVQKTLNDYKELLESANSSKALVEIPADAESYKNSIEAQIKSYLDNSAYDELRAQRGNLYNLLTNAIDDKYIAQKYSSALWARLVAEKAGISAEIDALESPIENSYQTWVLDENNHWIPKERTSDADYADQIAEVNRIKGEIETLGQAVDNLGLLGDANEDGKVNVLDYQKVANMILDPTIQPEEASDLFANIDINQNTVIEVGDLTAIVKYIMNGDWQGYAAARGVVAESDNESLTMNVSPLDNGKQRIAVSLSNVSDYTAFQLDVLLPAGMNLVGSSLTDRAGESHKVMSRQQPDGSIRFLVSSVKGEAFSGNEGAVLYIDVEGANANNVELLNILFSDVEAQTRSFVIGGDATGINSMSTLETLKQTVYDLSGRVINGLKKGVNIIRRADGKTEKVYK